MKSVSGELIGRMGSFPTPTGHRILSNLGGHRKFTFGLQPNRYSYASGINYEVIGGTPVDVVLIEYASISLLMSPCRPVVSLLVKIVNFN